MYNKNKFIYTYIKHTEIFVISFEWILEENRSGSVLHRINLLYYVFVAKYRFPSNLCVIGTYNSE